MCSCNINANEATTISQYHLIIWLRSQFSHSANLRIEVIASTIIRGYLPDGYLEVKWINDAPVVTLMHSYKK